MTLKQYKKHFVTERGFRNFQWVLDGVLARSSQPNYQEIDGKHDFGFLQADFLKQKKITCVISSNEFGIPEHSKKLLATHGISYSHYKLEDRRALKPEQLVAAAEIIEGNRKRGATLVYCGFGQGRTGTIVAAWAVLKHKNLSPAALSGFCNYTNLRSEFGVEEQNQVNAIRAAANLQEDLTNLQQDLGTAASSGGFFGGGGGGGPSGLGLPDDMSEPAFKFANFSFDDDDDDTPPIF